MIQITKFVEPDITVVVPRKDYRDQTVFERHSVSISEMVNVVNDCDEEGNDTDTYHHRRRYYACRLTQEGLLEICHMKHGWIPVYKEIQQAYNEQVAENQILGKSE